MILSDQKILEEMKKGTIVIEPFDISNMGGNSYDVHLSKYLAQYVDKTLDAKKHNKIKHFEIPKKGFVLKPGQLYLGSILEYNESHKQILDIIYSSEMLFEDTDWENAPIDSSGIPFKFVQYGKWQICQSQVNTKLFWLINDYQPLTEIIYDSEDPRITFWLGEPKNCMDIFYDKGTGWSLPSKIKLSDYQKTYFKKIEKFFFNYEKENYYGDIRIPVHTIQLDGSSGMGVSWPKKFSVSLSKNSAEIWLAKGVTFQVSGNIKKFTSKTPENREITISFDPKNPPSLIFEWEKGKNTKKQTFILTQ